MKWTLTSLIVTHALLGNSQAPGQPVDTCVIQINFWNATNVWDSLLYCGYNYAVAGGFKYQTITNNGSCLLGLEDSTFQWVNQTGGFAQPSVVTSVRCISDWNNDATTTAFGPINTN